MLEDQPLTGHVDVLTVSFTQMPGGVTGGHLRVAYRYRAPDEVVIDEAERLAFSVDQHPADPKEWVKAILAEALLRL